MAEFLGPVREDTDAETFYETGSSIVEGFEPINPSTAPLLDEDVGAFATEGAREAAEQMAQTQEFSLDKLRSLPNATRIASDALQSGTLDEPGFTADPDTDVVGDDMPDDQPHIISVGSPNTEPDNNFLGLLGIGGIGLLAFLLLLLGLTQGGN